MKKYNVLILTDHTNHSKENSLYDIGLSLMKHPLTDQVDIATRGYTENDDFFKNVESKTVWASPIQEDFAFSPTTNYFFKNLHEVEVSDYDIIWLRLPPPLKKPFLDFIKSSFPYSFIINDPYGIYETGSKAFLMNFQEVCPPMKICTSVDDIVDFKSQFPIVLKPFREYGGKGIVRIKGDKFWEGNQEKPLHIFWDQLKGQEVEYLGVKFLENVTQGDKRIIVVDGQVLGASLRLPSTGSWLCNVAMGGSSNVTDVDDDEYKIVETINPLLSKMGIVMYGVDTLVNDQGVRVLSEINTTSIGGLSQIARLKNLPLVDKAVDLIMNYYLKHAVNDN